jgi:hypothetical protein
MAVLAKGLRDHVSANHPEQQKRDDEKPRKTKQMPCISQKVHLARLPEAIRYGLPPHVIQIIQQGQDWRFQVTSVCEENHVLL